MLRFFRQLRKKMVEHQKAQKYLLYAIGEILLVVIGILIALQVNTWNEQQKANEAEQFLLSSLKEDFRIRYNELKEFEVARKETIHAIHTLNAIIHDPEHRPSDSRMDTLMATMNNWLTFNDQFKTLDMLFTTGMINELTNEDLKRRLIEYPQQVEEMMEEQRARIRLQEIYIPLQYKYVAVREVSESFDFRGYAITPDQPVTFPSDYEGLLKDPVFERYLADLEALLFVNEIDAKIIMNNAQQIIALLNQMIKET